MIPSPNQITGPDHGGIDSTIETTIQDRLIVAYVQGADEQMKEIRGYGLTEDERE